jgi:hypothetical protein
MCRGFNSLPNHNDSTLKWLDYSILRPSIVPRIVEGLYVCPNLIFSLFSGILSSREREKDNTFRTTVFQVNKVSLQEPFMGSEVNHE